MEFTFRQLGTDRKVTIEASDFDEARKSAASKLGCRASACLHIPDDGIVKIYILKNWSTRQKHKIKANDFESARREMAAATDTHVDEWILRDEDTVPEASCGDIEYLSFDTRT